MHVLTITLKVSMGTTLESIVAEIVELEFFESVSIEKHQKEGRSAAKIYYRCRQTKDIVCVHVTNI